MRRVVLGLVAGVAWLFATGGVGRADDVGMCIASARDTAKACSQTCKSNFMTAVAVCHNVDPGCAAACQQQRDDCVNAGGLGACLDGCNSTFRGARDACKTQCNCGDACGTDSCFIGCIGTAAGTAFSCRLNCQASFRANNGGSCQKQFRTCISACSPPSTGQ